MKALMKHFLFLTALVAAALSLTAQAAYAATITVDADGTCTLAKAIAAANTDTGFLGGCPAGSASEADIITLMKDVTLTAALPDIRSAITIEGNGHRIDGNNDAAIGSVLRVTSASGNLTLNRTTITGGNLTAYGYGAGIFAESAVLTLNGSKVNGNSATYGAGIYAGSATVTLNNSTVSGNATGADGGGIYANYAIVTLNGSTVSGNSAVCTGGGISTYGATVTLNNSTVSGNSADQDGGGILAYSFSTVTVNNSTVNGNSAVLNGGGISDYYATVILNSSLVSGNLTISGKGNEVYNYKAGGGSITAASFNLFGYNGESNLAAFEDFTPGSSDVTATNDGSMPTALAAILSPLADNGGPTQTHALPAGSPAIDLDAACSTGLSTDQRGIARPATGCDAGSFEGSTANHVNMTPIYKLLLK